MLTWDGHFKIASQFSTGFGNVKSICLKRSTETPENQVLQPRWAFSMYKDRYVYKNTPATRKFKCMAMVINLGELNLYKLCWIETKLFC